MAATQKKKQQEVPAPQVEARIDRMVDGDYKTKAYASVTIAGAFAVHGLRVIETDKGRFISMPQESYKKNGETVYNDTFHAVTAEARTALVDAVNDAYEQKLQERMEQSEDATMLSVPAKARAIPPRWRSTWRCRYAFLGTFCLRLK